MTLRRTPLHALHVECGARFCPFAGFEMPLQYRDGLRAEHLWTRSHAGFFDVSHMGQVGARGATLHADLERALPIDFSDWPEGVQRYSLLLDDDGGIVDDLMVTRLADEVRIVVNASGRDEDLARLRALSPALDLTLLDDALVALQGPAAEDVLASLDPRARSLAFMHAAWLDLAGVRCLVSRSGYTGEDGFEISIPAADAERIARLLLGHREVAPVGLGARDTLRLEAGLPLCGQDLEATTTPVEAGLGWSIARARRGGGVKEGGFPGADRVLRELRDGAPRRFGGFVGVEAVPVRTGASIVDGEGQARGQITSGTVSPVLGRPIMMGYLDSRVAADAALYAVVRGEGRPIARTSLPFVPKRYKRAG